jgi:2-amino-4-hydroxy-6-hydroxymethyldihydropteridine diphosphokinase
VNAVVRAFVGLGSNLDDPAGKVEQALAALDRLPRTRLLSRSSLYRTAPLGLAEQPDFVNAVAMVETALGPGELLAELLELERRHGRIRTVANGPRTLDLDLLYHGDARLDEPGLRLPHPRLHERAFVVVPLAEIAPEQPIPGHGTARERASELAAVQRIERA